MRRSHDTALAIDGLTKRYGTRTVVDDLTVDVPAGVIVGFVGPNGAGKTTTMAMLLGLVRPTSGTGTVLGDPLHRPDRFLPRVGALVEGPGLWPGLSGRENLGVVARLGGHDLARVPALLELVGLADRAGDRYGEYSLGMKQRLGIAAALLGDPELLVLDEPTNGLDPVGMSDMRDLIVRVASEDRTVLVSSHLLSELEQICDWLLVIDDGRLTYAGAVDGLAGARTVDLVAAPFAADDVERLAALVRAAGLPASTDDGAVHVVLAAGDDPRVGAATVHRIAAGAGIALVELSVRRPTLESTYLRMIEGASR